LSTSTNRRNRTEPEGEEKTIVTEAGIRRVGPPQAVQKVRDNTYLVQVPVSAVPSADWRRLFYETQQDVTPDFLPRSVEVSGPLLRFRTDAASVAAKIPVIDRWIERANQKEASMAGRSEEQRRRREDQAREQQELAALNETWANL
jgi:hypothetical protein